MRKGGFSVEIVCKIADRRLALSGAEHDGPPPPARLSEGFGTSFLRRAVSYELQGSADPELLPHGMRWTLEFPLKENIQDT